MNHYNAPHRGDIYQINLNHQSEYKTKKQGCFVVITTKEINELGVAMMIPIAISENSLARPGFTVSVLVQNKAGLAICNQIRSFDLKARLTAGQARFVESLDPEITSEIVKRVLSVIQPA